MLTRAALVRRARDVRLLAMDVDGVLTDGTILILDSGEEVKFWNVKDRIGFFMLRRAGTPFRTAWITGRKSRQVRRRAAEIGVDFLRQDSHDKGADLRAALRRFRLRPEQALYIGDDLVDLPALRLAGLAVCPADAVGAVRAACHWATRARGGRGAFREAVDLVLRAQGLWRAVLARFEDPSRR
jgi:3-deoxy-D-manno-octulosonate 8-phosphate phosphatase (KDO 8-P phosphatase)